MDGTAERALLSLLDFLLRRSHFRRLSRRDSEVAKSLNADYLNQLFILCSSRRLDKDLVNMVSAPYGTCLISQEKGPTHLLLTAVR